MATDTVLQHETPIMTAQGLSHDLDIYPDRLIIHSTDMLSRLFGHDEVILLSDIKSLHTYKPTLPVGNWSQLIIILKNGKSRGLSYSAQQHNIAQTIKDTIEDYLSRLEVAPVTKST